MKKLYIMCGLAFSGKSTLARKIAERTGSILIAFDKVWVEKDKEKSVPKNAEGWRYIRNIAQAEALSFLNAGSSVVYDDNNPRKEHREELREMARKTNASPMVIYLNTPRDIINAREKANTYSQERHSVEPKNAEKVLNDFQIPTPDENVIVFTPKTDMDNFLRGLT